MLKRLNKMKLASKLAVVIGLALLVVFAALIIFTALLSSAAISGAVYGELGTISRSNSQQIQQIFDAADNVAKNIQIFLQNSYSSKGVDNNFDEVPTDPVVAEFCTSTIYNRTLAPDNYDAELYMSESARMTAVNNADVVGVAVMFEPFKFQKDIKDYAFYVSQDNATDVIEPLGAYEQYSKETYYKMAKEAGVAIVTPPYEFGGNKLVSYSVPITYNNEVIGVVSADINIENFKKVNAKSENYPSMYATIYDNNGTIVYDSEDSVNVGKSIMDFTKNEKDIAALNGGMSGTNEFRIETTREDGRKVTRFFTPVNAGNATWWSLTALNSTEVNQSTVNTVVMMLILSAAALTLIILVVILLLRYMLRPMAGVVSAAHKIADGHLDVELDVKSEDEIGILSGAFQQMSQTLRIIVDDVRYQLGEMSGGNFNVDSKAEDSYVGEFEEVKSSIKKLNNTLSDTLTQINQAADQVSGGSDQVSAGAQALSQGATEQASSVEELAATINEISGQVKHNAENATESSRKVVEVGEKATESNTRMQDMLAAMSEISGSSQEISKIIKTIEDIAFQTNILALNAAVEAARAGAAGKGFAVVADEVRNLSSKSAEASKNTAVLIESSLLAVQNGTKIADETAATLNSVVEGVNEVTDTIEMISSASNEQATSIAQITQGIDQISSVVQTNSATAEESAAASEELSSQAQLLKELVGRFKLRNANLATLYRQEPEYEIHEPLRLETGKY